jgi:hypothetical protein
MAAIADAFAELEPLLVWRRRAGADSDREFAAGHSNATIVGPEGLETRKDVWVGVSLMAPGIRYPDHQHPPEEVYVVLSPGEWRQALVRTWGRRHHLQSAEHRSCDAIRPGSAPGCLVPLAGRLRLSYPASIFASRMSR